MILELDTEIIDKIENITSNQLVFLTLVLDDNQKTHQAVSSILSLVSETEIQDLISKELIIQELHGKNTVYRKSEKLEELLKRERDPFDDFYELFPTMVIRPDGTKGFLRANLNRCRAYYKQLIGHSMMRHQHILDCLRYEIFDKTRTGKLGYMKTMWKWLTNGEWEAIEQQMQEETGESGIGNSKVEEIYGTTVI